MKVTHFDIFHLSTAVLFLIYYYRSKIYIFIWIALLNIIMITAGKITISNFNGQLAITLYVLLVLSVYLYKHKYVLLGKSIIQTKDNKLNANDNMVIPFLIWIAFNIVVKIFFKH